MFDKVLNTSPALGNWNTGLWSSEDDCVCTNIYLQMYLQIWIVQAFMNENNF